MEKENTVDNTETEPKTENSQD